MTLTMPLNTEWNPSSPLTVGVEWELQILDRKNLTPKNLFEEILNDLPDNLKPYIHKEIYKSMLEIVTPPSFEEEEPIKVLYKIFETLKDSAIRRGYHLVGLGTLFTETDRLPEKNITPRYKRFIEEFGELLDDFYIYGIHIHIGFPNPEWALKAYNNLIYFAPLLLALSASSPFYRGRYTGIHSYRTVIFERLPRAELPPQFKTYKDYEKHVNELYGAGIIDTIKDIWYHIRLRPDFGTVEVRVFDSIYDIERIKTLIKLLRAIAKYSSIYGYKELPHFLIKQNWWYAKRYSLDADFFKGSYNRKTLKQIAFDLIFELDELGVFKRLNYERGEFLKMLRKPSPARDIEAKAKALKSLEKVVKMAALV